MTSGMLESWQYGHMDFTEAREVSVYPRRHTLLPIGFSNACEILDTTMVSEDTCLLTELIVWCFGSPT